MNDAAAQGGTTCQPCPPVPTVRSHTLTFIHFLACLLTQQPNPPLACIRIPFYYWSRAGNSLGGGQAPDSPCSCSPSPGTEHRNGQVNIWWKTSVLDDDAGPPGMRGSLLCTQGPSSRDSGSLHLRSQAAGCFFSLCPDQDSPPAAPSHRGHCTYG